MKEIVERFNPKWIDGGNVIYVGIDPGQCGAVGLVAPGGFAHAMSTPVIVTKVKGVGKTPKGNQRIKVSTLYDEPGMARLLHPLRLARKEGYAIKVMLEEVSAQPKDGRVSAFKFGVGFGMWRGILAALAIPYELVRPAVWKPVMGLSQDKNKSRQVCMRLYPELELPLVKDSDKAEAVLLAEYCRRRDAGQLHKPLKKGGKA